MVRVAHYLLETFGLLGAGLIFLLEGLGAPLPVEIPLWIIGARMSSGRNGYWEIVLLMWSSTVVGNTIGYLAGYWGGRPAIMKLLQWFRIKPETWNRMEGWFHRHGLKIVVATRWTNWGFAQNMWLSGITRMQFRRFFLVMAINDFFWAMGWTWLAREAVVYLKRHSIRFLHASTMKIGLIALTLVAIGLGVFYGVRWLRQRRTGRPPGEKSQP